MLRPVGCRHQTTISGLGNAAGGAYIGSHGRARSARTLTRWGRKVKRGRRPENPCRHRPRVYNGAMANRVIHISDAEAAGDFSSLLDRVRAGDEVVIEHDAQPVAVLRPAPPAAPGDALSGAERERAEFRWLGLNRERYEGRWVTLDGDSLLAVGDSAQEVYAAVANHDRTPLVTRVEREDEPYFAGW